MDLDPKCIFVQRERNLDVHHPVINLVASLARNRGVTFTEIHSQQIPAIIDQLKELNIQKGLKENMLLNVKAELEKEVQSKVGFLDELTIMFSIIGDSLIAGVVYFIWFMFLLLIELLILIGKSNDTETDYDITIQKQMAIHIKKIDLL